MYVVSNSAHASDQIKDLLFAGTSFLVKGFAFIVPDVLVTDRGLLLLYLKALENDKHLFIKETMDYEWAESRAELNSNSGKKQKIVKF